MRRSVCLSDGLRDRHPHAVRGFRHNSGGIIPISGFIFYQGSDD